MSVRRSRSTQPGTRSPAAPAAGAVREQLIELLVETLVADVQQIPDLIPEPISVARPGDGSENRLE